MVFNRIAGAALAASVLLAAAPSAAVITTFATYQPIGTGANIYWKNNAGSTAGTGGSLYTLNSPSAFVAGTTRVRFSFLQAALATYVTDVIADFTLLATTPSGNPATGSPDYDQTLSTGGFTFTNANSLTVGGTTYAPGTANLLTATFTGADILGRQGRTSGNVNGDNTSGTLTYTSDFLNFTGTVNRDFSLALSATSPSFFRTLSPSRALRTFKASSSGVFSSDPAPLVISVPEPQMWAMMIGGMGMVGLQMRRRKRQVSTAA